MRFVGLILGVGLASGGAYFLVTGLQQVLDFPLGNCLGADCFDLGAAFVTLPASIIALVLGGIMTMVSLNAIRARNPGALGGVSGLSALGALFVLVAGAFLVVFSTTDSIVGGTFVLLSVTFLATGAGLLGVDQWLATRRRRATRLRESGMRGSATILGVSDSNVTINNDPVVNLRLQVNIPNHPPYAVDKRQLISRIAVGRFVPGAVLPVLVDPADPNDVMLDDAREAGMATDPVRHLIAPGPASGMAAGSAVNLSGSLLSPDLMATIGDALRRAADQFAAGELGGLGTTTITVNGQTFQVPGGAGQTVVIEPSGRIITTPGSASPTGAAPGDVGTWRPVAVPSTTAGEPPSSGASTGAPVSAGSSAADAAETPDPDPTAPAPTTTSAAGPANGRISIDSLHDTGTVLGDLRLYSFELTVRPTGGQPYKMPHAALVPSAQVPRVIRGASFPAVIDPSLPGGLGIFWDR